MDRQQEVVSATRWIRPTGYGRWSLGLVYALVLLSGTGCASVTRLASGGWVADYETAEQRVRESGRELLILYEDTRPGVDGPTEKAFEAPPVKNRTRDFVRCKLFKPYEPDRRYVAQFGIHRAPALIVVHRDGTYHARSGSMSAAEIVAFLGEARPPGALPVINRHIPRQPRYNWHRTIEAAEQVSRQTGRHILIVYHRSLSHDWHTLKKLLTRREVYHRFADMVHCRIGLLNPWANAYITPFGALELPAVVIVRRDGTNDVLELPTSYETLVRFADAALRADKATEMEVTVGTIDTTAPAMP
ncbi:MAG: hypothetical protein WBE26_13050 [Phycisphaerae bacterium]